MLQMFFKDLDAKVFRPLHDTAIRTIAILIEEFIADKGATNVIVMHWRTVIPAPLEQLTPPSVWFDIRYKMPDGKHSFTSAMLG
jgi:hypothetical protein